MQKIIFLIGLPGCGKGTVAKFMKGYKKFQFGDIIRAECRKKFKDKTPEHMEATVKWFHTNGREKLLASRMWQNVIGKSKVVIDGCRNKRQFTHFCKLAGQKPTVVYVYSPRTYRWKLIKTRGRKDSGTRSYLIARDARELRQGLTYMIHQSDFRVSNRGTKLQLKKSPQSLMEKIN